MASSPILTPGQAAANAALSAGTAADAVTASLPTASLGVPIGNSFAGVSGSFNANSLSSLQTAKLAATPPGFVSGSFSAADAALLTPGSANTEDAADSAQAQANILQATQPQPTSNIIPYTPEPNLLLDYASYTYSLSLHAIPIDEFNKLVVDNKNLGKHYTPTNVLIASAGRYDNASFKRNPEFTDDFFFENLKLSTITGESNQTRMTNAIDINFTIIEPYGVTLLNRLIVMAENLGVANHTQMPYMLQIDFYGSADDGVPAKIPNVTKYIPIRMLTMKIKVSTKGAEYDIAASPFNHQAFADSVVHVPAQFEVTATTVGDFFDSNHSDSTANYTASIADLQNTNAQGQIDSTRIADEKQKFIDQSTKDKVDVRSPSYTKAISAYNAQLSTANQAATLSKPINARSFTAAYNAWFKNLYDTKKQKTFDSISFVIDSDIASAVLTPPEIQPASHNDMTPPKDNKPPANLPPTTPVNPAGTLGSSLSSPVGKDKSSGAQATRKTILETAAKAAGMQGRELAAFMAQCEHESGGFVFMYEIWGPTSQQNRYEGTTLAKSLGNINPGDGFLYRGRGFIQITGRSNYAKYSKLTGLDLTNNPDSAVDANNAAKIAIAYWQNTKIQGKTLSQQAQEGNFHLVTVGINGGTNGEADRNARYEKYLAIYGASSEGASVGAATPTIPSAQAATTAQAPNASSGTINYPVNIGKSVVDIISDVVRNSSYIRTQLKDPNYKEVPNDPATVANQAKAKALDWFKIVPEITLGKWDPDRNEYGKSITYYIIKSTIYNTAIQEAPQGKPNGAVKQYFYIFTGLNRDVLNFNLEFNSTYFVARTAMSANATKTDPTVKQEVANTTSTDAGNAAIADASALKKTTPAFESPIKQGAPAPGSQENRSLDPTTKITSDLLRSILSKSTETLQLELKIVGDPDFIKQDDLFYSPAYLDNIQASSPTLYQRQRTENGSIIMDKGQIHAEVYFQTPSDYDANGLAMPGGKYTTSTFSGVYRILKVDSEFRSGKFEQTLQMVRIQDQPAGGIPNSAFVSTDTSSLTSRDQPVTVAPASAVNVAATPANPVSLDLPSLPGPKVSSNLSDLSLTNSAINAGISGVPAGLPTSISLTQAGITSGISSATNSVSQSSVIPNLQLRNNLAGAPTTTIDNFNIG